MKNLTLALIAHDSKKDDIVQLLRDHRDSFERLFLIATRSTGQIIRERTGLDVTLVLSGNQGGDHQIGALVANGEIDSVIFLRDPLTAHSHEPDVSSLLRVCDVHSVPLATNLLTAEAVLYLLAEHPEALGGHHLAAQLIEEIANVHN